MNQNYSDAIDLIYHLIGLVCGVTLFILDKKSKTLGDLLFTLGCAMFAWPLIIILLFFYNRSSNIRAKINKFLDFKIKNNMTNLQKKKFELEEELKKVKEQEEQIKFEKEKESALKAGYYIPLATGKIEEDIWRKGERDFEELGDDDYYTVDEILGEPDFKKDEDVVQIHTPIGLLWVSKKEDLDYYLVEENEPYLEDTSYIYQITLH